MFENDFIVEFNDEELGESRTYLKTFKGYEQAIKDLKLYKAKQNQRIAELEDQLKNAIVLPIKNNKFYYICYPMQEVIEYCVCKLILDSFTTNDHDTWLMNEFGTDWFATKEEAEAKLREFKGENK